MKAALEMQSSLLRETLQTQSALLRSVREAAEATAAFRIRIPAPEAPDDEEEESGLDGAVAQALQTAMAKGFAVPPPGDGKP